MQDTRCPKEPHAQRSWPLHSAVTVSAVRGSICEQKRGWPSLSDDGRLVEEPVTARRWTSRSSWWKGSGVVEFPFRSSRLGIVADTSTPARRACSKNRSRRVTMMVALVLLGLGGVAAGCLYTPDANGHATVPHGITSIGDAAFEGCSALVSIGLPPGLTSIGASSFKGTHLTSLVLPTSVTSIGDEAFRGCRFLVSMALPDSLTTIGDQAFAYCRLLDSIALHDDVSSIGYGAFQHCSSLALVYVPVGCTVGDQAFDDTAVSPGYVRGREPPSSPSPPSPPFPPPPKFPPSPPPMVWASGRIPSPPPSPGTPPPLLPSPTLPPLSPSSKLPPSAPSVPSPVLILTDSEANIEDEPQDNTLGLAIGLPLGGCLLVAALAAIIHMSRKRRMKQPEAEQDPETKKVIKCITFM
jgi:hypothetical protein